VREAIERGALVALDSAAAVTGLFGAGWLFARTTTLALPPPPPSPIELALQAGVLVATFFFLQLYHQPRNASRFETLGRLFRATTIAIIVAYALQSLVLPERAYPPRQLVFGWLATLVAVVGLRFLHRAALGLLRRAGVGRIRVLIVGGGPAGQDLISRIHRRTWPGYEIVGLVDDTPGRTRARGVPVIGTTAELDALVAALDVSEVMIALPEASHATLLDLVTRCDREGTTVRILPDVFQIMAGEVRISDLDGLPLITMRDMALRGWRRTLKRALDIAVSAAALVALSPLLLLLIALVKLESRGPAFFVQRRTGLDMRPFPILKIRSMRMGAEAATGPIWARRDDPRVTRLGRFLRRTNLDELPQFINVLLGHMSIVGPRPERPEFVAQFRREIPRYAERHRERVGITGWAQVNGLRGNTSIEERTKYDLYYIENWSLLLDLEIIARTLLRSFRDPNAY